MNKPVFKTGRQAIEALPASLRVGPFDFRIDKLSAQRAMGKDCFGEFSSCEGHLALQLTEPSFGFLQCSVALSPQSPDQVRGGRGKLYCPIADRQDHSMPLQISPTTPSLELRYFRHFRTPSSHSPFSSPPPRPRPNAAGRSNSSTSRRPTRR
jgi:hypothetical protein